MNNDLTINTLSFKLSYSDKTGSLRREISRGVNLPETMTIRSQDIELSAYAKAKAKQITLRFDRFIAKDDGTGTIPVSAHLVVTIPADVAVTATDVQAVVNRIEDTVSGGLDLADEIFVNGEQ